MLFRLERVRTSWTQNLEIEGDRGVLWVDARSEDALERGRIPGAVGLNEDDWSGGLSRLLEQWMPDQVIVVYCDDSACDASESVADRLKEELGMEEI